MATRKTEREFKTACSGHVKSRNGFLINTADSARKGVPDMFVCIDGISAWLELKWIKDENSTTLEHHASATQIATLKDINKAGGLGFLLVGRSDGVVFWSLPDAHGEVRSVDFMNKTTLEDFFDDKIRKGQDF